MMYEKLYRRLQGREWSYEVGDRVYVRKLHGIISPRINIGDTGVVDFACGDVVTVKFDSPLNCLQTMYPEELDLERRVPIPRWIQFLRWLFGVPKYDCLHCSGESCNFCDQMCDDRHKNRAGDK